MPETINIAGKPYPRNAAIAVGAAAAAFIGYTWFIKGRTPEVETETDFLVPEEVEPTGVLPFGGTQSGTFTEGPVAFRNDQEWYAEAVDRLLFNYGVAETPVATDALDRYLASRPMTSAQIPMITYVINSIGPPPSGARQIRQETATPGGGTTPPPTATKPGIVTRHGASASRTEIRTNWYPPTSGGGVTSYVVTVYQGVSTGGGVTRRSVWSQTTTSRDVRTGGILRPGSGYDVGVKAVGAGGTGPESFKHVTTRK
jgi:hypothetical protein